MRIPQLLACLSLIVCGTAFGQGTPRAVPAYPDKPIRVIVPFGPGT